MFEEEASNTHNKQLQLTNLQYCCAVRELHKNVARFPWPAGVDINCFKRYEASGSIKHRTKRAASALLVQTRHFAEGRGQLRPKSVRRRPGKFNAFIVKPYHFLTP